MDLLCSHFANSLWRLFAGFSLAAMVGVVSGLMLNRSRALRQASSWMMTVPSMVWVPIFMIFLGTGSAPVIATVFLAAVFAISYETAAGCLQVPPEIIDAAMLDGAGGLILAFRVTLPCAWSHVVAGLRLGVGYGLRALIGAEMLAATLKWGLGRVLFQSWFWYDVPTALITLGLVVVLGTSLDMLVRIR